MEKSGKRILILGASGFLGNALYKELSGYFDTYGTYYSQNQYGENQKFHYFDMQSDDVFGILRLIKPHFIISSLRGNFANQIQLHEHIIEYQEKHGGILYFLSSANVFDAYSKFPSYETDKTLSQSIYGKLKIRIENMLMRIPKSSMAILRVPMVFGNGSPRIKEIKDLLKANEPIEVFPNLVINITFEHHLSKQIHYLINHQRTGIYHLGSSDLIHHEDLIKELIKRLGNFHPVLKKVYTTNDERYLAALPKINTLPKHLFISCQEVIDYHFPID